MSILLSIITVVPKNGVWVAGRTGFIARKEAQGVEHAELVSRSPSELHAPALGDL